MEGEEWRERRSRSRRLITWRPGKSPSLRGEEVSSRKLKSFLFSVMPRLLSSFSQPLASSLSTAAPPGIFQFLYIKFPYDISVTFLLQLCLLFRVFVFPCLRLCVFKQQENNFIEGNKAISLLKFHGCFQQSVALLWYHS